MEGAVGREQWVKAAVHREWSGGQGRLQCQPGSAGRVGSLQPAEQACWECEKACAGGAAAQRSSAITITFACFFFCDSPLQDFAEKGALASPAARALNAGTLMAALIHTAVELRMLAGEQLLLPQCKRRGQPAAFPAAGARAVLAASRAHAAAPLPAGAPAGFVLPLKISTWVFAGLTSAAGLVAGSRPADLAAEMREVAEGVKKED